jgi:hypothetical protein
MLYDFLYRRKRQDRWWRFRLLKEAFVKAEGRLIAGGSHEECLREAFKRFGYPVPPPFLAFWAALVEKGGRVSPELTGGDLAHIEARAGALDATLLPYMCWLDLFRLCIGLGLFQVARVIREKALDCMVADASRPEATVLQVALGCYAEVERENFDQAGTLVDRMERLHCGVDRCTQVRWYISLMAGDDTAIESANTWASVNDPGFGKFIAGKRIALVGPVATTHANGSEIDSQDLVVKFGYRGGLQGCDRQTQGERVDIAYYNNTQAENLSKADYKAVFSSLRWAVFHNRKGISRYPKTLQNLRHLTSLQWFLPDTHFNAGPNAVVDMLRFRPEAIRVFNTDMMLSSGRFSGYRQPDDKPTDYTRSFIKTHDPILQYQTMRRLWTCGYLSGDERFDEVMSMGLTRYLTELQNAYGADTRALF